MVDREVFDQSDALDYLEQTVREEDQIDALTGVILFGSVARGEAD